MNHFIERARACGHVVRQCRCPMPNKLERWVEGHCPDCQRKQLDVDCPNTTPVEVPSPASVPWRQPIMVPSPNRCPTCAIDLSGVLGYVCPRPDCPTGLGGVRC